MITSKEIEDSINEIKKRNERVEENKAWETSSTRKIILTASIYLMMGLLLTLIKAPDPWLNSLIPAIAFILSTLTLPFIKRWWVNHIYKR